MSDTTNTPHTPEQAMIRITVTFNEDGNEWALGFRHEEFDQATLLRGAHALGRSLAHLINNRAAKKEGER